MNGAATVWSEKRLAPKRGPAQVVATAPTRNRLHATKEDHSPVEHVTPSLPAHSWIHCEAVYVPE